VRSIADPSLITAHRVVLTGLLPGTTYRYRARSASASAALTTSAESTFTTAPAGSGPDIATLFVRGVTGATASIAWDTTTGMAAQVEYGTTTNYGSFTLLKIFTTPAQNMVVDGLRADTTYHFRVKAWDGDGFLGASTDATFTTAPAGAATLIGDQTIQSDRFTLAAGQAAAYQFVASQSGQASVIRLYVDAGSTSPVIRVALYSDRDGTPGTILTQGSAPGLGAAGWVEVNIPPLAVLESSRYWVAVLSPLGAGSANLRQAAIGGSSVIAGQSALAAFPQTWTTGVAAARAPLSVSVQQVPPAITLTGPDDASVVTGRVPLSAVVDDDVPLARVQFYVDGLPVGAAMVAVGPYAVTWDSTGLNPNVPHTISARATDVLGRFSSSRLVSVQVDNGPLISRVSMSAGLTSRSARINWVTDALSDAQVEYGPTLAYGSTTPIDVRPEWQHEMQLSGLLPGTLYHYRVRSRDANGGVALSADQVFFTAD